MTHYRRLHPRTLALLTALCACNPDTEDSTTSTATTGTTADPATGTTDPTTSATDTPTGTTDTAAQTSSTTSEPTTTGTTGTTAEPTSTTDTGEPALCEGTTQSNLPGVSIVLPPQKCVFTVAEAMAGVTFEYAVEITDPLDDVTPKPNDAGNCEQPDASGLIVSSEVDGGDQHYCLCDQGLCPAPSDPPISLVAGSFPDTFEWNGLNWNGPSDTNNPFGAPFPPGDYLVNVRATGTWGAESTDFAVTGTLAITLVP